jgi:hypothetical protein
MQIILIAIATTVPILGHRRVNPSVNFNVAAQTISKNPAINNKVHAICLFSLPFDIFLNECHVNLRKIAFNVYQRGWGKSWSTGFFLKRRAGTHPKKKSGITET